ncbi:MAG: glucose-6-phosphate dehydrogenase assembly protein OpcA [Thermoleophilia bacterium]|nr:glucose-6-phosphate dehydrogenase assembly protein OpcA [Thermoleophilia bacterium]
MSDTVSVVAEVERELARQRCRRADGDPPELRTSTLTHVAWVPPRWLDRAHATLDGLEERHPARTILLVPEPRRRDGVEAKVEVREFDLPGLGTEVMSEVVEVRLRGAAAAHPSSIVLPLLVSDLPVFCRWRGDLDVSSPAFKDLVRVVDRLVVDSAEWRDPAGSYPRLTRLFERVVVSDLAYRRGLAWRLRLSEHWPGIRSLSRIRVVGPKADALLLAGWLRSRLRRAVELTHRSASVLDAVTLDGVPVAPPQGGTPTGSDALSAELEVLGRDPVYEAAARRADA